jgi:sensor histidine kinase YesM
MNLQKAGLKGKARDAKIMKTMQAKLFFLFMAIALLPVLAMGLYSYRTAIRVTEEKAGQTMVNSIEQMGKNLDYQIRNYKKYMDLMISSQEIRQSIYQNSFDRSALDTLSVYNRLGTVLSGFFYHDDSVYGVMFYKGNRMVYAYRGFQEGVKGFEQTDIYHKALSLEGSINIEGMLLQNNESGFMDDYYVFGRRLSDYSGTEKGEESAAGVFLFVQEKIFSDIFKQVLYHGSGKVMIINEAGTVFSHTDKQQIGSSVADEPSYRQLLQNSQTGSYSTEMDGRSMIVACYDLPQWGLKVVQTIPSSEFARGFGAIARSTLWISAIMMIIVFLLSLVFSQKLTAPVKIMVKAMKRVQNGQFEVEIPQDFGQEFNIMAQAFNYMASKLKELIARLVEEEKTRGEIEYNMLQYQINPHFVNNTLGSIRLYAWNEGSEKVAHMLQVLSRLFQRTLGRTGMYVRVRSELSNLKDFLFIQQMLYNERMTIIYEVDESLQDCLVPNLLLQPLVENSIFHGLSEQLDHPQLIIGVHREGQDLIMYVKDNGKGMEQERLSAIMNAAGAASNRGFNQIGVRNIDLRLKLHFGERYGVRLESTPGSGTRAEVKLPILMEAAGYEDDQNRSRR